MEEKDIINERRYNIILIILSLLVAVSFVFIKNPNLLRILILITISVVLFKNSIKNRLS